MTAEHKHRAVKVDRIVAWLLSQNVSPRVAAAISPDLWDKITGVVGVTKLRRDDDTTRLMVLGRLQLLHCVASLSQCDSVTINTEGRN